jgi:single-stranded-DNA-specific exonuclease
MDECRFEIADCPPEALARLRDELGVSDALAQVLVRRGHSEPADAEAFLAAGEEHAPQTFEGIERAVESVLRHARAGVLITVHGDYDVDGICSTAILVKALRALGAAVSSYLPDRGEGYGLREATVRRLAADGTGLLITADCGITAVDEVALARSLGVDVVVSDHHRARPDGVLPDAPIVHPAICGYPCSELCATAVAYKLAQALHEAAGLDPRPLQWDLDLVALATIADLVPLLGENRTLVRRGLRALALTRKPGLRALMAVAGIPAAKVDERGVGFGLAPRLNAAGRLYRADAGLELVLTEDPQRAEQVARELDDANSERRQVEQRIRFEAEAQMAELGDLPAYVLSGESWHAGVIGIVASRLVEVSGRPVVMVALDGETGRGSGRSIEAFDLLGGLSACAEQLERFGGHRAAAGLELRRDRLDSFALAFAAHAGDALRDADTVAVEHVDAIVGGADLGMDLAEELERLAPFGRGNPKVNLMVAEASFSDPRPMGEGRHVRFTVNSEGARASAVCFGAGKSLPVPEGEPAEATFALEINEWNGASEPRLVLRRAQPTRPAAEVAVVTALLSRPQTTAADLASAPAGAASAPAGAASAPVDRAPAPRPQTAAEDEAPAIESASLEAFESDADESEDLVLFALP